MTEAGSSGNPPCASYRRSSRALLLKPSGFRGSARRLLTFPAWGPLRALDSLYVRGRVKLLELHRGETQLAKRASDHRPLFADLMIEHL